MTGGLMTGGLMTGGLMTGGLMTEGLMTGGLLSGRAYSRDKKCVNSYFNTNLFAIHTEFVS